MALTVSSEPKTKTCRKCGQEKPVADFSLHPKTADGRHPNCRSCAGAAISMGRKGQREEAAAEQSVAPLEQALTKDEWDDMFMLIVFGAAEQAKAMKQCYSKNPELYEIERAKIMKAFARLQAVLPSSPEATSGQKLR